VTININLNGERNIAADLDEGGAKISIVDVKIVVIYIY